MHTSNPETILFQSFVVLVMTLIVGPWATLSAFRVIRDPSHVREKSFINWTIQLCAESHFLMPGNIRFWAWMVFLLGSIFDLIAICMLVVLVKVKFFP
jgi:hypothetical protein